MTEQSILEKIINTVREHPENTITVEDVKKQLPELSHTQIRSNFGKGLKDYGYLLSCGSWSSDKGGRCVQYKILSREDLNSIKNKFSTFRKEKRSGVTRKLVPPADSTIESSKVGEAIYDFISKLKAEISRLTSMREQESKTWRDSATQYETRIVNLKNEIRILTESLVVKTEDKGRTFKLSDFVEVNNDKNKA